VDSTPYVAAPAVTGYPGRPDEVVVPAIPAPTLDQAYAAPAPAAPSPEPGASTTAESSSPAPVVSFLPEPPQAPQVPQPTPAAEPPAPAAQPVAVAAPAPAAPAASAPAPTMPPPTMPPQTTFAPQPPSSSPLAYLPEPSADSVLTAAPPTAPTPAPAPSAPSNVPDTTPQSAAAAESTRATLDTVFADMAADRESFVGRQSTEQGLREGDFSLVGALERMLERGASDLHLTASAKPTLRISGQLVQIDDFEVLTPPVLQRVIYAILTQAQRLKFEEQLELDFAYSLPGRARFRVNVYRQRDSLGAAFRIIPFEIKSLESLGIPPAVANFANLPRGFVLVTGPTGSGKSTTLASIVDLANRTRHDHIMTVEDPIEFLHRHKSCLVNQREVGEDTWSFSNALKHVLRQDPDIILVGEMRDLETISVALTAAETGHLVFATLHTQDAAQTIDRVIDVFPPHQQTQVRAQLAMALQGVVCQTLAKSVDGHGRVVATEVLVVTPAVRNLIREGKSHQIYSVMQAGAAHGMHTLDQHLADLVRTRRITYETGLEKCHHVEDFNRLCGRA
jgi:twitching motility protein PilT